MNLEEEMNVEPLRNDGRPGQGSSDESMQRLSDVGTAGTNSPPTEEAKTTSFEDKLAKVVSRANASPAPTPDSAKPTPKGDGGAVVVQKKKRRKKKWKKPKDKPSRPLSAYNLFFQKERANMLGKDAPTDEDERLKKRVHCKTHGKIGFAEMARSIASKWKNLDPTEKKEYEEIASKEKARYATELATWKEEQKAKSEAAAAAAEEEEASAAEAARESLEANVAAASNASAVGDSMNLRQSESASGQQVMSDNSQRSGTMPPMFQGRNPSDLSSLEYLRALREQQQMDTSRFGRSHMDMQIGEYPSAAEASANLLMQQFQGGLVGQGRSAPQHTTPDVFAQQQLQGGQGPHASRDAMLQRLLDEQEKLTRQKETVDALMQQLQGGVGANPEPQARPALHHQLPQSTAAVSMEALMQQYGGGGLPSRSQDLLQQQAPGRQLGLDLQRDALGLQNMGLYRSHPDTMTAAALRQLQQRYGNRGNTFNFQGGGGGGPGEFPPPGL